jgi:hypothetical protein
MPIQKYIDDVQKEFKTGIACEHAYRHTLTKLLSVDDIMHYQRIIIALTNTARIMSEIDQIDFLPEGE